MRELALSTREKLESANKLIAQAQDIAEPWKVSKNLIAELMAPAKEVLNLLNAISDIHPAVKVLVGVVKVVVSMELQRLDNDKRIAVVYSTMISLLLLLSDLDPAFDEGTLQTTLAKILEAIRSTISEFGNFCEVYYKQKSFVRTLWSSKYKDKLAIFAESFADHKEEVYKLMTSKTALMLIDVKVDVAQVLALLESRSAKEKKVISLLDSMGGYDAVVQNEKELERLAEKLSEKWDASVRRALKTDLDKALEQNHVAFGVKIEVSTQQILGSIDTSTNSILTKLDQGPHELIEDPDIKAVWKDMQCRTSAKTRIFLDAVYNHFLRKFQEYERDNGVRHPDAWTLFFLSNLVFYPAISEGIDGDSSGFVSVHEVNNFMKSKPSDLECSSVAWIAFWAVGPCKTDAEHSEKIASMIRDLNSRKVLAENQKRFKYFQAIIKDLRLIHVHDDIHEHLEELEYESEEYGALMKLQVTWRNLELKRMATSLEKFHYQLNTLDYIPPILDRRRLEHSILCLCYLLLHHHMKIIDLAETQVVSVYGFQIMRNTWESLFYAFEKRFGVLQQIWRQQRMEIGSHVNGYAGGLFAHWYARDQAGLDDSSNGYDTDDADYSYTDEETSESETAGDDGCEDEAAEHEEDGDQHTSSALPPPATPSKISGGLDQELHDLDSPEALLMYLKPEGSEDEDGLTTEDESEWESAPKRKREAENELKERLDKVESRLGEIQGMLQQLLISQQQSTTSTSTKPKSSIATNRSAVGKADPHLDAKLEDGHSDDDNRSANEEQKSDRPDDDDEVEDGNHLMEEDEEDDHESDRS